MHAPVPLYDVRNSKLRYQDSHWLRGSSHCKIFSRQFRYAAIAAELLETKKQFYLNARLLQPRKGVV